MSAFSSLSRCSSCTVEQMLAINQVHSGGLRRVASFYSGHSFSHQPLVFSHIHRYVSLCPPVPIHPTTGNPTIPLHAKISKHQQAVYSYLQQSRHLIFTSSTSPTKPQPTKDQIEVTVNSVSVNMAPVKEYSLLCLENPLLGMCNLNH
jgi:hypothetical protein